MKLYGVPKDSLVTLLEDAVVPPGSAPAPAGTVLRFDHLDGMYSHCRNPDGTGVFHPFAGTNVQVLP